MGDKTKIQWTDATWNPLNGCSRISAGCMHCYAERLASRFSGAGQTYDGLTLNGKWTGNIRLAENKLLDPLRWKQPRRIFVNSMSDLFHENVPDEWIDRIFAVMALASQHTFQVLTKRPERMHEYLCKLSDVGPLAAQLRIDRCAAEINGRSFVGSGWPLRNVWLGVSVENQETADGRIPLLLETPAETKFISYEPALGPVDFSFWLSQPKRENFENDPLAIALARDMIRTGTGDAPRAIDWIIVGGESGPGARRFDPAWARSVVAQCKAAAVPVFVKQMGSNVIEAEMHWPGANHWTDHLNRKGDDPEQWPEDLRVRECPQALCEWAH